ncbi:MAG: LemA family protein [Desulfobacteraceae bacterium]|nr:LemA family protein [Desulfobacteraceae bacterium]
MQNPLLKFFAFCSIAAVIVLFCVVFGGYTSFYRSQNRIEDSKSALVESCRERLLLLPELSNVMEKVSPDLPPDMNHSLEKARVILGNVLQQKGPLEEKMTKDFENSQTGLTMQIKEIFARLKDVSEPEGMKEIEALKQKFFKAQDNLYVAGDQYNYEVSYFNGRVNSFPVSLIAKLFGFHDIRYYPFSDQAFLPARKAFEP